MRSAKFYRMLILLLVTQVAFVSVLNQSASAAPLGTIIHQDGFTVDGVERQYGEPLNTTTVEGSSLRWNAPTGMEFTDIDGEDVVRAAWGSGNGAVIDCDLALVGGTVKIEVDAMTLGNGSSDDWVAIGFQPQTTPFWVVNPDGLSMLFRGNGGYQIFTAGGVIDDESDDPVTGYTPGDVTDMSITYDSTTNTATFVINGQVVFASGDLGTGFADAAKRPFVTTYDTGMYVDNFTVSMEGGTLPAADIFLQSPADNTWHVDTEPELSWGTAFDVDENTTFDVYLDPNDLLVNNLDSSALVSSQTGFRYTPDVPLEYDKTYYWRIETKVDGTVTQTSEVRSFITDSAEKKWSDRPWMDDDDLDLSTGKIYTHKVKFNDSTVDYVITVMEIDFESDSDRSGENWSLSGAGSAHAGTGGDAFYGTGEGVILNTPFYYGSPATLTLTGLTPGEEYRTTFYTHAWGGKGGRFVDITTSDDGKTRRLDENVGGNNRGWLFMYNYTAPESGELAFEFNAVGAGSWHHYSFTNEVATDIYLEPTPVPWWAQVPSDVDLSWQLTGEVAGTLSYHLSIATDPNMKDLVVDTDLSENTYPASLTPYTTYYWQVQVLEDGTPVHESPIWDFETYEFQKWFDASWMTDDDLDLSNGKIYTHKVKFNAATEDFPTTVLGVDFENDTDRSGDNWSLADTPLVNGGTVFTGTGEGVALNTRFYYGAPSSLTLTGLTPGVEYRTTLYTHGWGNPSERRVDIKTSDDGWIQRRVDENIDGDGNGHLFMYYYTGPDSGSLTFEFFAINPANTWHHYSFSNEIVTDIYLDPTPVPGASIAPEVLFGWQLHGEVADARYNLLVATDSGMQNLVVNQSGLSDTELRKTLTPEMDYWWKVEVTEGQGGPVVHESPVWDFTTSPPPDAEKVLEWKMDETAGPTAYQTGTSEDADGVLSGFNDPNLATFVSGLVGNGLLLNGTSEYVDVSNAFPYMPTGDEQAFAVSAYFRTFKEYGPIFSMRNETNGTPLIDITIGNDGVQNEPGRVCMLVRDDGGSISWNNSGIKVNDGRWHSLVVMRARGNWTMYVDGVMRGTPLVGVASGEVSLNWLSIGAEKMWVFADHGSWNWQNTHIRYFKGILDEVCVWAGEMQPGQIEALAAVVPPAGDLDFDLDTDEVDLKVVTDNWLMDSYTPVQSSPMVLEDMESYTSDPNTYAPYWEALEGVSLESVGGNTDTAPAVGLSLNSIQIDAEHGQVLQWDYDFEGQSNVMERFWLRDRRVDLGLYDQISVRVKKLAGSTGEWFYFDFHDGRGLTELEFGDPTQNPHWKSRVILPLADLPEGEWQTLVAAIPSELSGRARELNDFYEVSIGISMGTSGTTGTMLIDEITLTDATDDCFPEVGVLLPDMNGDCLVNINDFAIMAGNWLQGL